MVAGPLHLLWWLPGCKNPTKISCRRGRMQLCDKLHSGMWEPLKTSKNEVPEISWLMMCFNHFWIFSQPPLSGQIHVFGHCQRVAWRSRRCIVRDVAPNARDEVNILRMAHPISSFCSTWSVNPIFWDKKISWYELIPFFWDKNEKNEL